MNKYIFLFIISSVVFSGCTRDSELDIKEENKNITDYVYTTKPDKLVGLEIPSTAPEQEIVVSEALDIKFLRDKNKKEEFVADAAPPPGGYFLIADFDKDGMTEREWDCPLGAWISDPTDPTIRSVESYDPVNRFGSKGYALKLWYDLDSPNPAYGGLWVQFRNKKLKKENLDLSPYKAISLYIRGSQTDIGFTTKLKIEIKNSSEVSRVEIRNISRKWKKFVLPLEGFKDISDWRKMTEMVILLEADYVDDKEGVLYFDDVHLEK